MTNITKTQIENTLIQMLEDYRRSIGIDVLGMIDPSLDIDKMKEAYKREELRLVTVEWDRLRIKVGLNPTALPELDNK